MEGFKHGTHHRSQKLKYTNAPEQRHLYGGYNLEYYSATKKTDTQILADVRMIFLYTV